MVEVVKQFMTIWEGLRSVGVKFVYVIPLMGIPSR